MISHDDVLEYCKKLKITPNQFNFCYLMYIKDWSALKEFSRTDYIDSTGNKKFLAIKQSEVNDLIERGFIVQLYDGEKTNNSYMVTEKFGKYLFTDEQEAGEELWNAYFDFFIIGGVHQSAKTTDKDKLLDIYLRKIKRNKNKHKYVMQYTLEYIKLVKEGKMNAMGIEKFVLGENWEIVRKILEKTGESWDDSL